MGRFSFIHVFPAGVKSLHLQLVDQLWMKSFLRSLLLGKNSNMINMRGMFVQNFSPQSRYVDQQHVKNSYFEKSTFDEHETKTINGTQGCLLIDSRSEVLFAAVRVAVETRGTSRRSVDRASFTF